MTRRVDFTPEDADRFYRGIFPRFAKSDLELHPEKTKLVPFKRPPLRGPNDTEPGLPGGHTLLVEIEEGLLDDIPEDDGITPESSPEGGGGMVPEEPTHPRR